MRFLILAVFSVAALLCVSSDALAQGVQPIPQLTPQPNARPIPQPTPQPNTQPTPQPNTQLTPLPNTQPTPSPPPARQLPLKLRSHQNTGLTPSRDVIIRVQPASDSPTAVLCALAWMKGEDRAPGMWQDG
jgi:hypothetical protein